MRKWTWAATAMLVAVPLACFWLAPRSAITEANFAKLHKGMTRAEVEAVLGGPASHRLTQDAEKAATNGKCREYWFERPNVVVIDMQAPSRFPSPLQNTVICVFDDDDCLDRFVTSVPNPDAVSFPLVAFFRRMLRL